MNINLTRDEAEVIRTALAEYANSVILRNRTEGHAVELDVLRSKVADAILDEMLARIEKKYPAKL